MAIRRLEMAVTFDEMLNAASDKVALAASWAKKDLLALAKKHKLTFDEMSSRDYPINVMFSRTGADEAAAQKLAADVAKKLKLTFTPGITSGLQPVNLLSSKVSITDERFYVQIVMWKSGKLTLSVRD